MNIQMREALILFGAATIFAVPALAKEVEGSVRYDLRRVKITHAYARNVIPMPEELNRKRTIKIIFADRALDDSAARSEQAFTTVLESAQVNGFQLEISHADNSMTRFIIGHPEGGGTQMSGNLPETFDLSGLSTAGGMITGRLKTRKPHDFFPLPEIEGAAQSFSIDVRFQTQIVPALKSDLVLTSAAAQASPQAQRAIAQHALLLSGDPAKIRAGLDPGHPLAERFATDAQGRDMLRQLRQFGALVLLPAFRATIKRVEVRGNTAWVLSATKSQTARYTLYREGDEWRVAPSLPFAD